MVHLHLAWRVTQTSFYFSLFYFLEENEKVLRLASCVFLGFKIAQFCINTQMSLFAEIRFQITSLVKYIF